MARAVRNHRSGETNDTVLPLQPGGRLGVLVFAARLGNPMEALFTSTALVALAEIGDKTQLLAIVLASRLKRPLPIVAGIFCATVANHALAAFVGSEAAAFLQADWFRILIALSFIAMGLWTLVPDTLDPGDEPKRRGGAFVITLVSFFLVEMGDKTQLATIALGARFQNVAAVTAGTTLGMMLANVPAVFMGNALIKRVPMRMVRLLAALLFVAIGAWMLIASLTGR